MAKSPNWKGTKGIVQNMLMIAVVYRCYLQELREMSVTSNFHTHKSPLRNGLLNVRMSFNVYCSKDLQKDDSFSHITHSNWTDGIRNGSGISHCHSGLFIFLWFLSTLSLHKPQYHWAYFHFHLRNNIL